MANITVRGYVNRPETRTVSGKKLGKFTLSEKVKDPKSEKGHYRVFWNVDVWEQDPPEEGSYVEVCGYLKVRQYEHNGVKRQSLDIKANDIVTPEKNEAAKADGDPFAF